MVPTYEQLIGKKRSCAKFQQDISKTERLSSRIYRQTDMTKPTQLITLIIYKLRGKLILPCSQYTIYL